MRNLTFNGITSNSLGVAISGEGSFDSPSRDMTVLTIPGRNGDLIIDNGRFANVTVTYPAFVYGDLPATAAQIRAWLMSPLGYARLEDDYHPDEFRQAIFSGTVGFDTTAWNQHAEFEIKFNCKPQRFLKSGETPVSVASGGTITNPTPFTALPNIRVTASGAVNGTLTINGTIVTFTSPPFTTIFLNCDTQECYNGVNNLNQYMSGLFPVLVSGENTVTFDGNITAVSITPRWWRI